jgi:hypothetical protein
MAAWLGDEPLFGLLGGLQGAGRHGRNLGLGEIDPLSPSTIRLPRRLRDAADPTASTSAGPTRRCSAGSPPAQPQALRRAGLLPRQPAQPRGDRSTRPKPAWASSPPARPTSMSARRSTNSASTMRWRPDRHSPVQGRHGLAARSRKACATSPKGSKRSWSSRKSASSSNTSSRRSSTTGARTCARASSASSTRRANGRCCRPAAGI